MATTLKLRRGTTTQHSTFTGAEGEVTVDTTKDTLVVHDGATAGGIPLAKESALGTIASQNANNVTITGGSVTGITDITVTDGGTGASTAAGARTNLLPSYATNGGKVLAVNTGATDVEWISRGGDGTVTSVAMTVPTGLSVSGTPVTGAGTLAVTYAAGYAIPTTSSQTNWDTAYTDRLKWDGGATGLTAATGRTSLGLGTIATQAASSVSITGGSISGITDLAVADGGTGASTLTGVVIGNGTSAFTTKTNPTGDFVGTSDTQTLTNKTLTDPAIVGTILEDVYTISDGAAFEVDPGNGSIQLITLGASRTPKATNFTAGESVTLMVDDGTAYTLTWTDATWGGSGVVWKTDAGVAPTLNTSGYTVIVLWKVSTQVYGARVGNA